MPSGRSGAPRGAENGEPSRNRKANDRSGAADAVWSGPEAEVTLRHPVVAMYFGGVKDAEACPSVGRVAAFGRGGEHGREKAGKALLDVGTPQLVHMGGAVGAGAHEASFAQDAEMMRHAGFRPSAVERRTGRLARLRQLAHDAEAHGIAEGVENPREGKVFDRRMVDGAHAAA